MVLVVHRNCWAMMVLVVHHRLGLRNDRILDGVFFQANSAAVVSPIRFDDFLALVLVVLNHLNVVSSASSGSWIAGESIVPRFWLKLLCSSW
jgi:hypothetical protein